MLSKYENISKSLAKALINDNDHKWISSGVHAILFLNSEKSENKSNLNRVIYLFYWPLPTSFELKNKNIKNAQQIKRMKKDPSCLLSRVLHEISSTVCISVHSQELKHFGPVERNVRRVRNYGLSYKKTQESQFSLAKQATKIINIDSYEDRYKLYAQEMFLLNGSNLRGFCKTYPQEARAQNVPYRIDATSEKQLISQLKQLNKKYILKCHPSLENKGIEVLAKAIITSEYNKYQRDMNTAKDSKDKAIKSIEVEAINNLTQLKLEKRTEFQNFCMNNTKYRKKHDQLKSVCSLNDNWPDAIKKYLQFERFKINTLSGYKRSETDKIIRIFTTEITTILNEYQRKTKHIENDYDQKFNNIQQEKAKGSLWGMKVASDLQKQQHKEDKEKRLKELEKAKSMEQTEAIENTMKNWIICFKKRAKMFMEKVEQSKQKYSPLNIYTIKKKLKNKIDKTYSKKKK
eukprot:275343_1